jgi:two-component system sensor histidine kinase DesK
LAWALREGVTNVIRHSEGRSCRLSLQTIGPDAVITVTDDGVAPAAPGVPTAPGAPSVFAPPILLGNGLRGLGERLALAGGRLDVGPVAAGGFRLRASVPLAVPVPSRSAAPGQAARNEAPADPAGRPAAPAPR